MTTGFINFARAHGTGKVAVRRLDDPPNSGSCFPDEMIFEFPVWRVCNNPTCQRIFRFGDPDECAVCFSETSKISVRQPVAEHGDYAYRHGYCKCAICREAHRVVVNAKRQNRRAALANERALQQIA